MRSSSLKGGLIPNAFPADKVKLPRGFANTSLMCKRPRSQDFEAAWPGVNSILPHGVSAFEMRA